MSNIEQNGARIAHASVRTTNPPHDDEGLVVRPILGEGLLQNGVQTVVGGAATSVLAANLVRAAAVIQNVGGVNARIGAVGVTAVTGMQLVPGATLILEAPFIPTQEVFAVSEGAATMIFAAEILVLP